MQLVYSKLMFIPCIHSTLHFQDFIAAIYLCTQVIGQGCIQHYYYRISSGGTMSAAVGFFITKDVVPLVKILGVFVREDGELVADLIELPVQCEMENEVYRYVLGLDNYCVAGQSCQV